MNCNSVSQIINSEYAVSTIISQFSPDFIMDVIEDNIKMKFRPFNVGPANFPAVLEQQFNLTLLQNPAYKDAIDQSKTDTYTKIIQLICNSYNLSYDEQTIADYNPQQLFSLAMILFDIFVTNFTPNMISFFVRYIINNKEDIYRSITGAEEIRKNKEATSYGRKIYSDPKLVVIHSDLNNVLTNIAAHDIPFPVLMSYLTDAGTAEYLLTILKDNNDIYKYHFASYINNPITRPDLFTAIKFNMQSVGDKAIGIEQFTSAG